MNEQEIARRRPVWTALAELFLDTDSQDFDRRHIADRLRTSGYTLKELQEIFDGEVAPVFHVNLTSVAGEWQPWDADFVQDHVLAYLNRRPSLAERCLPTAWLRRRRTARVQNDWDAIQELLRQ